VLSLVPRYFELTILRKKSRGLFLFFPSSSSSSSSSCTCTSNLEHRTQSANPGASNLERRTSGSANSSPLSFHLPFFFLHYSSSFSSS
jgi:hypothetical protein